MALSSEEEATLKNLLIKLRDDNPRRYIPQSCLREFHAFCAQAFTELVFWRIGRGFEFLLKYRNDQWWKDTWHIPGTKHDPGTLSGNPLQVAQVLAEREFPGIRLHAASVVDSYQWKMDEDHPWCNPTSVVTLCDTESGAIVETETQRFFTIEEATALNLPPHHLDFLHACHHALDKHTLYVHLPR